MVWVAAMIACGRGEVVYDAVGGKDAIDDLVYATLLFGSVEGDPEQIEGPHVAGGSLTVNVRRGHSIGSSRWFASTLEPAIASVVSADANGGGLTIEIAFYKAGTTDLFIFDEDDAIIDVQPLAVREPVEAALVSWDDLAAGDETPLLGTVHLVAGSVTSLAVTWRDVAGVVLNGGDLLTVDGSDATPGVTVWSEFTGAVDVLDIAVDDAAVPATFGIDFGSPGLAVSRDVEIHIRSEVDRLELVQTADPSGEGGLVQARVSAGADRMVGAPVQFRYDGKEVEATGFTWTPGPTTTVEACFEQRCSSLLLRGRPDTFTQATADAGCGGCNSTGGAGLAWLGALLVPLVRRRQPAAR